MTNVDYVNTFIAVAEDCLADRGIEPPVKPENPSIAARQFAMIGAHPYAFTSADVIFDVHADRSGIADAGRPHAREQFFAQGRACLRASNLGKRYGWGIHCDGEGRVALVGVETPEYASFLERGTLTVVKAMRSRRA